MKHKRSPTEIDHIVGQRIKTRRRELHLSQADLAAHLGISYQQVQKYEVAENRVSVGMLLALAEALGVAPSHFYEAILRKKETA